MRILVFIVIALLIIIVLGLYDRYIIIKKMKESDDCRYLYKKPKD